MQETLKQSGVFLLKAIIFSLIFWVIWVYVLRPITSAQLNAASPGSKTEVETADNNAAMKTYMEQAKKAEEQQNRMDKLLEKQEEQARRLDAVLSSWEKQTKGSK